MVLNPEKDLTPVGIDSGSEIAIIIGNGERLMKRKIWFAVLTGMFIVIGTRAQTLPAQGNKAVGPFSFDLRAQHPNVASTVSG